MHPVTPPLVPGTSPTPQGYVSVFISWWWPSILTFNNTYVTFNIYIYELVTPEYILSSWARILCASKSNGFIFIYSLCFFHIPWLILNCLHFLFLMLFIFWTPSLCFSGIRLRIIFSKGCIGGKLYECFQVKKHTRTPPLGQ